MVLQSSSCAKKKINHVCSDLNARCGLLNDYSQDCSNIEQYINNLEGLDDNNVSFVGERKSMDSIVDSSGLKLIDICKNSGLKLLNGRIGQDKDIGYYTFHSVKGKNVIDYVLCHYDCFKIITDFLVNELYMPVFGQITLYHEGDRKIFVKKAL